MSVTIAAAQLNTHLGETTANIEKHLGFIEIAAKHNAQLILFPELSLTGYCRDEAASLYFSTNDERLKTIQQSAINNKIWAICGAPIKIKERLYIGAFVISPEGNIDFYTKQYLHTGEDVAYSSSFNYNPDIEIGNFKASLGICYDIENEAHVKSASKAGSNLYLASIFYPSKSMAQAHSLLGKYACENKINIIMSNYCGQHWSMKSGGESAAWSKTGELITSLQEQNEGIALVTFKDPGIESQELDIQ
ncbi:MAG: carbon-nitrogen hydrolase family protein [Bacteroidales bacterium]|nr:carbon-nitrogen hydrolase family protein [Bacteroidales bacterium]